MQELKDIKIIYEDNHLLVVVKPINIPVQADDSHDKDFLSLLKEYIKEKYKKPGNVYLGLVHRLDRPVAGIMVFAKTSKAASRLSEEIRLNKMTKIYHAVVTGTLKEADTLTDYLIKDEKTNTSKVTSKGNGKEAILDYEVINRIDNLNLVKINLKTGRSHQIRVQFSSRNNPLYGDSKYGDNPNNEQIALFASAMGFQHPVTKEDLYFELELPNRYPFSLFKKVNK